MKKMEQVLIFKNFVSGFHPSLLNFCGVALEGDLPRWKCFSGKGKHVYRGGKPFNKSSMSRPGTLWWAPRRPIGCTLGCVQWHLQLDSMENAKAAHQQHRSPWAWQVNSKPGTPKPLCLRNLSKVDPSIDNFETIETYAVPFAQQSEQWFIPLPSPVPSTAKSCDTIWLGAGLSVVRRPLLGLSPPEVLALSLSLQNRRKKAQKGPPRATFKGHFRHTLRFNIIQHPQF
jgi:hypothetical protein